MDQRKRSAIVGVVLAIVALVALLVARWSRSPSDASDIDGMAVALRETAAPLPRVSADDPVSITEALLRGVNSDDRREWGDALTGGLAAVAQHLAFRARGDVPGYIAEMKSQGRTLPDALRSNPIVIGWWEHCSGEVGEPSGALDEVFAKIMECNLAIGNGGGVAKEIASVPTAIFVQATRLDRSNQKFPTPSGGAPGVLWLGGVSAAGQRYWEPKRSLEEIIAREGATVGMKVAVIGYSATDRTFALHFAVVRDPIDGSWFIDRAWVNNNVDKDVYPPHF